MEVEEVKQTKKEENRNQVGKLGESDRKIKIEDVNVKLINT